MCEGYALGQGRAELDQDQAAGRGDPVHPPAWASSVSSSPEATGQEAHPDEFSCLS